MWVVLNHGGSVVPTEFIVCTVDVLVMVGFVFDGTLSVLVVHRQPVDLVRVKHVVSLHGVFIFMASLHSPHARVVVVVTAGAMVAEVVFTVARRCVVFVAVTRLELAVEELHIFGLDEVHGKGVSEVTGTFVGFLFVQISSI